ncbi:GPP34 family phosphoprotein [Streptomyces sp. RY43-2]|uniref:GPP34 family phosphoprotein n=1 Tax=Streptomyces macrolidinus TaxID=2952607 RepID=A0ABT0ZHE7_9ACTN|nr:GPP34 family phosphoprotein [Streptomyces macrolidinus]MCN9242972.1 GPP34 family phosphoprotein [Streptomyces macrolidinus]
MGAGLTVGERIVLLGLDERDGTPREQLRVGCAVAAAPLLRLVLSGAVVERDGRLIAGQPPAADEPLASLMMGRIRQHPEAKPQAWLLAVRDQAVTATYAALLAKGLVRREGRKVLGAFGSYRYPVTDPSVPAALRGELAAVVLTETSPTQETAELIALLHHAGLHGLALPDADPAKTAPHMAEVAAGLGPVETVGRAISAALAAVTVLLAAVPGVVG